MEHEEYLEGLFRAAFKQEADEAENLARTLPFFATSLAVVVALLAFAGQHLSHLEGLARGGAAALLVVSFISVSAVLAALLWGVWQRGYVSVAHEGRTLSYATELMEFHKAAGTKKPAEAVRNELRTLIVVQLAEAIPINRLHNAQKSTARSLAFLALVVTLAAVFLVGSIILFGDDGSAHRQDESFRDGARSETVYGPRSAPAAGSANASSTASDLGRRETPVGPAHPRRSPGR